MMRSHPHTRQAVVYVLTPVTYTHSQFYRFNNVRKYGNLIGWDIAGTVFKEKTSAVLREAL